MNPRHRPVEFEHNGVDTEHVAEVGWYEQARKHRRKGLNVLRTRIGHPLDELFDETRI